MPTVMPLGPYGQLLADDHGRRTDKIRVRGLPGTYVTVRLFTMFVAPGDTLLVTGEANLTNNTGRDADQDPIGGYVRYPVGVPTSLWVYNANAPADLRPATWRRLGTTAENATVDGHHIHQGLQRPYTVPADWDPIHQMGIVLRVDAHSSGSNPAPDYVLVETHGTLHVQHWPMIIQEP